MSFIKKCSDNGIRVFGEIDSSNNATESAHMITFFNYLRREHPHLGEIAIHIRNEGKRTFQQAEMQKIEGMVKGASDIIIPGMPSFVCEMKSTSAKATISNEQINYLLSSAKNGAFACVAIGSEGAKKAVQEYLLTLK